jgi:hypothetical protein
MVSTKLSATVLAGLLAVSLAACGSNDTSTGSTPSSTTSSAPAATAAAPSPKVIASLPDLSKGVSTTVTLDPQFLAGLTSLKLTPGVVGGTKLEGTDLVFPITGGSVTLYEKGSTGTDPFVVGVVKHDGQGITLTGGGHVVQLENFDVDAGKSEIRTDITVDGAAFGMDVPTFIADGSTLVYPPTMEGNNAILQGTKVKLTAGAAAALNKVFGTTALTEGFPVGVAKIAVATS